MKLTTVLMVTALLHASAAGHAQKITLTERNASLGEIFREISSQTGYEFLYDTEMLKGAKTVKISFNNTPLEKALKEAFAKQSLTYTIKDKTIIVNKKQRALPPIHVKGKVVDEKGEPLPGVSVLIKGSNIATSTDAQGVYEIRTDGEATLIFSLIGFANIEIPTAGKSKIDVILREKSLDLDEVVVVGYNQVERRHIASSIAQMDMEEIKTRPIIKLQDAFSGTIPGATLSKGSNLPGSVPGTISIRGISTLQNSEPLVIVDGMEQSLTDIDPNQIKSITVLKDAASASMYGSRGANGVILIETERGTTGQFKVNLHSWAAINDPIDLPNFVNSADYMRLNNEARTIQNQSLLFTESQIDSASSGLYANTNWLDEVMQRHSYAQNTAASISGGGGVGSFNLMMGYVTENGLNNSEGTEKFSARFNTNINIADKFVLLADFYAHRLQVDRLYANDDGHGLYQTAWRMNPAQSVYYDSGLPEHYRLHNNLNPVASINRGGLYNAMYDRSTINLRPRYYINRNLSLNGNVSYMVNKSANKHKRETFKFFDGDGKPVTTWDNSVGAEQGTSVSQLTARATVDYERDLRKSKDKIYLIAGSEIMNYTYTDYREISKASFFGKLNYSFNNRFLLEGTVRSDGSSKFAPGYRWGFFPSGAIAWNLHNENFMSSIKENGVVNNLKLRVSYGLIGNENVDPYLWQEDVNEWGWSIRVPNPMFSWEKQKQGNLGLDVTALKNRLNFTAEVYRKHSYDLIYSDFPVPPLTGSSNLESSVNIGEVENTGWELSASWKDKAGDFSYSIGGMLFDNKNKVLKAGYKAGDTLIFKGNSDKIWYKGTAIDNFYGYQNNGYFQNQAEVDAATAKLPNTLPGDIRYIDQNSDGIINDEDRIYLGDPFPHLNYALNVDLNYKRWDLSLLGQGVGKRTGRLNGQEGYPVLMDGTNNSLGAPRQEYADNRWTPENPNSRFPRVWTGNSSNAELSRVWLSNAAFFRMKTIQIGYRIPDMGKSFKNMRVYINAQDALTFTKWEGLEPERNGGNGSYPRMATYSFGIKATIL